MPLSLTAQRLVLLVAASAAGCDRADGYTFESNGGASGGGAAGAAGAAAAAAVSTAGAAGAPVLAGTSTAPSPFCQLPNSGAPVFANSVVSNAAPARRELFTWTTTEQIQEIRAGSVLMTRTEREGMGPGYAMEVLASLGSCTTCDPSQADNVALAALLSGPAFSKARYAWSEPWATRVGWPGETYGDQLVRMVLREDAWLARYQRGRLDVVDMNNQPVATADALAHPERLAGVYFVNDDGGGDGPQCYGSFRSGGGNGYREFIIGNEAMIEEWSLGTAEIRGRLEADIALVQAFFDRIRACPPHTYSSWNEDVVCGWFDTADMTEVGAYQSSLAIPSPGYVPDAQTLAALIETLQASLFDPNPFVVTPTPATLPAP